MPFKKNPKTHKIFGLFFLKKLLPRTLKNHHIWSHCCGLNLKEGGYHPKGTERNLRATNQSTQN